MLLQPLKEANCTASCTMKKSLHNKKVKQLKTIKEMLAPARQIHQPHQSAVQESQEPKLYQENSKSKLQSEATEVHEPRRPTSAAANLLRTLQRNPISSLILPDLPVRVVDLFDSKIWENYDRALLAVHASLVKSRCLSLCKFCWRWVRHGAVEDAGSHFFNSSVLAKAEDVWGKPADTSDQRRAKFIEAMLELRDAHNKIYYVAIFADQSKASQLILELPRIMIGKDERLHACISTKEMRSFAKHPNKPSQGHEVSKDPQQQIAYAHSSESSAMRQGSAPAEICRVRSAEKTHPTETTRRKSPDDSRSMTLIPDILASVDNRLLWLCKKISQTIIGPPHLGRLIKEEDPGERDQQEEDLEIVSQDSLKFTIQAAKLSKVLLKMGCSEQDKEFMIYGFIAEILKKSDEEEMPVTYRILFHCVDIEKKHRAYRILKCLMKSIDNMPY